MQVIFAVSDVGRSAAFYASVFDWPRNERIDYPEYVELCGPSGTLGRARRSSALDVPPTSSERPRADRPPT